MTLSLFITLITICCTVSVLFTEAIKKWYQNKNKSYSANMIALISSIIAGGGGGIAAFILLGIPFNLVNIVYLILTAIVVWLGSMVGYDKVIQTIAQIANIKK